MLVPPTLPLLREWTRLLVISAVCEKNCCIKVILPVNNSSIFGINHISHNPSVHAYLIEIVHENH